MKGLKKKKKKHVRPMEYNLRLTAHPAHAQKKKKNTGYNET